MGAGTCLGEKGCPLVAALNGADAGQSRMRQLRWVVGELHTASAALPGPPRDCAGWLRGAHLLRYLEAAESGLLRTRSSKRAQPSQASGRVRASCVRQLAALCGIEVSLPVGAAPAAPGTDPLAAARFVSWLGGDRRPVAVRTRAVAALAASGLGVSDLADLRLAELGDREVRRRVHRPGPGSGTEVSAVAVEAWAAAAVEDWLAVRREVVVSPRVPHVFCTCAATHAGGSVYAAGLPVSARGLARAHAKAVDAYFAVLRTRVGDAGARRQAGRLRLGALVVD